MSRGRGARSAVVRRNPVSEDSSDEKLDAAIKRHHAAFAAAAAGATAPAAALPPVAEADAFFTRALSDQRKTPWSLSLSITSVLFGVGALVLNEFQDVASSLTTPVPQCGGGAAGLCDDAAGRFCTAPSNGAFRASLNCSSCVAQLQALSDAGGFSRAACVGAAVAGGGTCGSAWATYFPDSMSLRQTSNTIAFTIWLLVLIGIVALVLVAVELYFQRRSALAFAVVPFRKMLRKDVLLHVLLRRPDASAESAAEKRARERREAAVVRRSRRHACCCGRDERLDCSGVCEPACACAPKRARCNELSLHASILFIGVVLLAVLIYFTWKIASIDAMLSQLSSVPVVVAASGTRLWAFSVSCGGSGGPAPLMLLIDIDGQRRAAISAPQQAGIMARVPSVVFALLMISSFLTPRVIDIVLWDLDPMKKASISTIVSCAVEQPEGGIGVARGGRRAQSGSGGEADDEEAVSADAAAEDGGAGAGAGAGVGAGAAAVIAGSFDEVAEGELDEALFDLLPSEGGGCSGCCRRRLRLLAWPLVPRSEGEAQRLVGLLLTHVSWVRRFDAEKDARKARAPLATRRR